jgi:hypothetical protein
MVSSRDFVPYLIAAKSFRARIAVGRFHVIDDGTLSAAQRHLIESHLGATVAPISGVPMGSTPRGGMWERLATIADLVADSYIIQLDSDTISLGQLAAVADAIAADASFTLITHPGVDYGSVAKACETARADPATDIHTIAEQRLDVACDPQRARYVHGCAGFAGFAKGSFARDDVYRFSRAMEDGLGCRWWEWGSEQIASNFMVSNAPRIARLPYPFYRNFEGSEFEASAEFVHFIGTHRFKRGIYARTARAAIARLPTT